MVGKPILVIYDGARKVFLIIVSAVFYSLFIDLCGGEPKIGVERVIINGLLALRLDLILGQDGIKVSAVIVSHEKVDVITS